MANTWRDDSRLRGKFHPEYPDSLQVLIHDGGPRFTDRRPELVWVRVTGIEGDAFTGEVLNQPQQLVGVHERSIIRFLVPASGPHPLMVSEKYLRERGNWVIQPCQGCGLSELFDAPSDLIQKVFPDAPPGAIIETFTAFCGVCGGVQVIQYKD